MVYFYIEERSVDLYIGNYGLVECLCIGKYDSECFYIEQMK